MGMDSKYLKPTIDVTDLTEVDGNSLRYKSEFYMCWVYEGKCTDIVGPLNVVAIYRDYSGSNIVAVGSNGQEQVIPLASDSLGDYPIFYTKK